MSQQEEVKRLIGNIKAAYNAGSFPDYIDYIRFPKYKNLATDTKIEFDFPFTVFTGLNGTGKSSTLHALYGAPRGKSTGNYWFSTEVDPIEEKDSEAPNCFIYGYKEPTSKTVIEVLKTRVNSKVYGPDYWEPSRPIAKYGMDTKPFAKKGTRNPTIKKGVIYLDFRAELSAFDKYFYFGGFSKTKTLKSKQDVLRKYSKYLRDAIDTGQVVSWRNNRKNKIPELLQSNEIKIISKILGKTYKECVLLYHTFFGLSGLTAYFKTDAINYSEAYAGRGEFAVVKLVHEISKAAPNSLIILDEPEVSLHPGAQIELKLYLLQAVLTKKLQVVISTHSANFVEFLPNEAIKLFLNDNSSKFVIKNSCNYLEAFQSIGVEIDENSKCSIVVEDRTAKLILDKIIDDLGSDYSLLFNVKFYAGGSEMIYKTAAVYSQEGEKHKFMMLDGDKKKPLFEPKNFTATEAEDLSFLKRKLVEVTGIALEKIQFRVDGNSRGGNVVQQRQAIVEYLGYLNTNLGYLPGNIPEETIWNQGYVEKILTDDGKDIPAFSNDYKRNILTFAKLYIGDETESSNDSAKKLLIKELIKSKGGHYHSIVNTLNKFRLAASL